MDTVIRKIHDHTREHYNEYKLKYYDRNMTLEILTTLTAYIAELRLFKNENSFIIISRSSKGYFIPLAKLTYLDLKLIEEIYTKYKFKFYNMYNLFLLSYLYEKNKIFKYYSGNYNYLIRYPLAEKIIY